MSFTKLSTRGLIIGGFYLISHLYDMLCVLIRMEELRQLNLTDKTYFFIYLIIVEILICVVTSFLLVLGILKQCHGLLLPWLITKPGTMCLCAFLYVYKLPWLMTGGTGARQILIFPADFVLYYVICLVYKELKASKNVQPRKIFLESSNII